MNIKIASDLHLEVKKNSDYISGKSIIPSGDILVLAGDIGYIGHPSYERHPFWDWLSINYAHVIVVPGNHEFYNGYDLYNLRHGMKNKIRENIYWYYNMSEIIEDIEFIMTPLWTEIPYNLEKEVTEKLNDFKYCIYNGKNLTVNLYNKMHTECVTFLKESLEKPKQGQRIVITHHAPSPLCIPEDLLKNPLHIIYYSNQNSLIESSQIDYWIYGHTHKNTREFRIGNCKLLCNQLGYIQYREGKDFEKSMQIIL